MDEVLRQVGLVGRDTEPVRRFSLGMKQRLGIAAALLTDPGLLILDEPTNGLDPAGIVEIRGLLRRLAFDGRTVIVSSHLLSEIEAICDHLVIIRSGEVLFAGPMQEMLKRTRAHIDIAAEHPEDSAGWPRPSPQQAGSWRKRAKPSACEAGADRAAELNRAATATGVTLSRLIVTQDSLEELFLEMTGRTDGELASARAATDRKVA